MRIDLIDEATSTLRTLKHRLGWAWPRRAPLDSDAHDPCAPARAGKQDVVCLAICDWDARFQRPQQLMAQFAAAGHRVFYIRPRFIGGARPYSMRVQRENVYEVMLRGDDRDATAHVLRSLTPPSDALAALRAECGIDAAATIVQLPFWWPLARDARDRFGWPVLYDCMDLHAGFSNVRRAEVVHERGMLAEADVVAVSSAMLERRALEHRERVLMLRNGCDYEHFARVASARRNARPVIGFHGAISDWFDHTLVAELAGRRRDWDFVLVGSTWGGRISRLKKLDNVSLPGEQPYASIPDWLGGFDVAIIPFRRTPLTEATNPVKVYEMLASGKPVVAVPLPEIAALAPHVRLASNAKEFEREIEAALAEDSHSAATRQAFAREQTWTRRFEDLAAALSTNAPERRRPAG